MRALLTCSLLAMAVSGCSARWIVRAQNQTGSDLLVTFVNSSGASMWRLHGWDGGVILDMPGHVAGNIEVLDPSSCAVLASGPVLDESTSVNVYRDTSGFRAEINRKRSLVPEEVHLPEASVCPLEAPASR